MIINLVKNIIFVFFVKIVFANILTNIFANFFTKFVNNFIIFVILKLRIIFATGNISINFILIAAYFLKSEIYAIFVFLIFYQQNFSINRFAVISTKDF